MPVIPNVPYVEQLEIWRAEQIAKLTDVRRLNPCVRAYGPGPDGKKCKTCEHLYRNHRSKVYIKCDLRVHTNGPGSDHKANWPACARYVGTTETTKPKG